MFIGRPNLPVDLASLRTRLTASNPIAGGIQNLGAGLGDALKNIGDMMLKKKAMDLEVKSKQDSERIGLIKAAIGKDLLEPAQVHSAMEQLGILGGKPGATGASMDIGGLPSPLDASLSAGLAKPTGAPSFSPGTIPLNQILTAMGLPATPGSANLGIRGRAPATPLETARTAWTNANTEKVQNPRAAAMASGTKVALTAAMIKKFDLGDFPVGTLVSADTIINKMVPKTGDAKKDEYRMKAITLAQADEDFKTLTEAGDWDGVSALIQHYYDSLVVGGAPVAGAAKGGAGKPAAAKKGIALPGLTIGE